MASTSQRSITLQSTGDIEYSQVFSASSNASSPMQSDLVNLSSGNNTITVPTGSTGVTIVPPTTNSVAIAIKSVVGDSNTLLIATSSPSSLGLATGVASFVLNAAGTITGVRIIFT